VVLTSSELKMVRCVAKMHHCGFWSKNSAYLHEKNRDSGLVREGVVFSLSRPRFFHATPDRF
jgi:hypothetical protein